MPHRRDDRNAARGDRAHHDFFVERPQILDRAAAAPNDEEIGARHRPPRLQRIESPDRAADLRGRTRPLHLDRRSEEHTSELQSLMRSSLADFRLKKKKTTTN